MSEHDLDRLTTNIVPPVGNIRAPVLFVGEAPGEEEDILSEPFVGSAGQFLKRCFADQGINKDEVLLHNIFKQRPPKNDVGYFFRDKSCTILTEEGREHVQAFEQWLSELYQDGHLNLVVALGAIPLRVLVGHKRIYKWRGSVLPTKLIPSLKCYPTLHPSGVLRSMHEPREGLAGEKKLRTQNALPLFLIDLQRIKEEWEYPEIRTPKRNLQVGLPFGELLSRVRALNDERLVACDIETLPGQEGEGPILWCVGFAASPSEAFVVPFVEGQRPAWPEHQEAELHQAISQVFLNPDVKKVFQNGAYDLCVLGRYYGYRVAEGSQEDTMLCHHASYPYLYKSLHVLTSIYTKEPYYKDEGKINLGSRNDRGEFLYNAKDCALTREIFPIVEEHAHEHGTWEGYRRTMSIQPSLLAMMIKGVRIDLEKKHTLARDFSHQVRMHETEIQRLIGKKINLNSAPQKATLLYGQFGLKVQFHPKTKKPTTDKDALQRLKKIYHKHEVVGPLLEHMIGHSKFKKLATDYTEMEVEPDGRVRTSYGIVSTWRLSSSGSHFGGGGNLQNIPKRTEEGREIRKLFIPDPVTAPPPVPWPAVREMVGRLAGAKVAAAYREGEQLLLARDLSQAEARVVAWEAEDLERIALFERGWDVHWYNARIIFSIPESVEYNHETASTEFQDSITGESHTLKQLRNIGKTVVHASNYGMGPKMLQTILAREGFILQFMACRQLLSRHKARNPLLGEWQRGIRERVQATRTLVSSYGRVRQFMGRMDDALYKSAYAFSPQNTVGELLTDSIQRIWETVPKFQPLLNVHDEVVGQCNPWDLEECLEGTRKCMEHTLIIHNRPLTIPSDASVGVSWGELEEI